jgi:hypothetical protein
LLANLVEIESRNYDEKGLTVKFFLDVAMAFDTVWVEGLPYKFATLDFPFVLCHKTDIHI